MMGSHALVWRQTIKQMFMILCGKCSHTGARPLLWKLKEAAPTQANVGARGGPGRQGLWGEVWKDLLQFPRRRGGSGWGEGKACENGA